MSQRILAIDPGTTESGFVVFDSGTVVHADFVSNEQLRTLLRENLFGGHQLTAIEMIASYGMAVGRETFETCVWIGRFIERSVAPVRLVYRREAKLHLCGSPRAKDGNVRQALIDRFGAPGTKKNKGATYGIKGHLWQALAVAVYASDTQQPNE